MSTKQSDVFGPSRGLQSSTFRSTGSDEGRARRHKDLRILSSNCRSQSELFSDGDNQRERAEDEPELLYMDVKANDTESCFQLAAGAIAQSRISASENQKSQLASQMSLSQQK